MYELIQVSENCYYVDCPSKIGIVKTGDREVCLIDSGSDKDAAKKVKKITDSENLTIKMIITTHAHADHIGGNRYLQENTGCSIYANGIECDFSNHTVLNPSFLSGSMYTEELTHKFILAKESCVKPLTQDVLPDGFEIIPLNGHSFDMIGIKTPDGVVYSADAYSSPETLDKYKITFLYDVDAYLESLERLKNTEAKIFVSSHTDTTDDISGIVECNINCVREIEAAIYNFCKTPQTHEKLLQLIFSHFDIKINPVQFTLVGCTVKSYLSWMKKHNKARAYFENNMMFWESI